MRRPLPAPVVALVALALAAAAGCGGGGGSAAPGGGLPAGSALAPETTVAFASLDTGSGGMTSLSALAVEVPALKDLVDELGGIVAAAGPETDALALTAADLKREALVFLTQPENVAAFRTAVERAKPGSVVEEIEGWQVVAETRALIDRFKAAREDGALSDDGDFREAVGKLPAERFAEIYADGEIVTGAFKEQLETDQSVVPGIGRVAWVSGSASRTTGEGAGTETASAGVSLQLRVKGDGLTAKTYTPELLSSVPADATVAVDFKGVDQAIEQLRRNPSVQARLKALEALLGNELDGIVSDFAGEGVLWARAVAGQTQFALVLSVSDEAEALQPLDDVLGKVGALGGVETQDVTIGGHAAKQVTYETTTFVYGAFDGLLVLANGPTAFAAVGSAPALDSDPTYQATAAAAGLGRTTTGIAYLVFPEARAPLESIATSLAGLVETLRPLLGGAEPSPTTPAAPDAGKDSALAAMDALGPVLAYGELDGEALVLHGFLAVK